MDIEALFSHWFYPIWFSSVFLMRLACCRIYYSIRTPSRTTYTTRVRRYWRYMMIVMARFAAYIIIIMK